MTSQSIPKNKSSAHARSRLPTQFDSPRQSPGFLLWQVSNAWARLLRAALKKTGITHPQFVLLANIIWLEDQNDVITAAKLSKQCQMDKMTVSDIVEHLEEKNFIRRTKHPNDSRSFSIEATSKGLSVIQEAMPMIEQADTAFFGRSSFSQDEIVRMLSSLWPCT